MATKKKEFKETLVNFILDKSGSMESVVEATISGFNEYVQTLRKDGNKYSFTLTLFDTGIETPVKDEAIKNVKELNRKSYLPNGSTALYDAVCTTIKGVSEKKDQKVITIIMTDGQENASKEYSEKQMRALIGDREKKGNWTFVYLGANQDSYAVAKSFGIPVMNTANFVQTSIGTARAFSVMAMATGSAAGGGGGGTSNFFSQADQTSLGNAGTGGSNVSGSASIDPSVSAHMSSLGKKSWEARKKKLL